MRVLIISDSHGKNDNIKKVLSQVKDIDMLVHLGDLETDPDVIRKMAGCECHMVAGNCDYRPELPAFDEFMIEDKRVLITHGHRFHVGYDLSSLREYGLSEGYDIVMYGHTHVPYMEQTKDITILNPGSISCPRQDGHEKTFMVIEVDDKGHFYFNRGILKSSLGKRYPSW